MINYIYACYNKECSDYKKEFSKLQSIKDDKLKVCDTCKKEELERLIQRPDTKNFKIGGIGVYENGTN